MKRFDFDAWIERYRLSTEQGLALKNLALRGDARRLAGARRWTIAGETVREQTLKSLVRKFYAVEVDQTTIRISDTGGAALEYLAFRRPVAPPSEGEKR